MSDQLRERVESLLAADPELTPLVPTGDVQDLVTELNDALDEYTTVREERRRIEEAEQQARLRLDRTFAALSEAVFVVDPVSRVITECNAAVETVFGYRPDEVLGRNTQFLHLDREMYERFGRGLFPALDASGVFNTRFEMKRKDGRSFVSDHTVTEIRDERGDRVGVVSVVRDVTAKHRAEEALRESEERYRSLVECSLDAVLLTAPDGSILSANEAACRMFGRSEEELTRLGRSCVCDPSDPQVVRALEKRVRTGRFCGEMQLLRADGAAFPAEISSVVYYDGRGEQRTSMVIRDISDRVDAQQRLREQEEILARVERVARMSEIATSFAHELNQPLTGILSSAQACRRLLAGQRPDLAEVRRALEDIVDDSRRAADFVASLREMMRKGAPTRQPGDINRIVHDALRLWPHVAPVGVPRVRTRLGRGLPRILVDPVQVQQVLVNLLANAAQATADEARGTAAISIATAYRAGQGVVVSVADRGQGVATADLERIFDALYTTRPDGLGLGLAICRSLVEAHGGKIWAERRRGGGARVSFVVPAVEGADG